MEPAIKKPRFILIKDPELPKQNKNIYQKVNNETRVKLIEMVSIDKVIIIKSIKYPYLTF
jgi:hypothetical protein